MSTELVILIQLYPLLIYENLFTNLAIGLIKSFKPAILRQPFAILDQLVIIREKRGLRFLLMKFLFILQLEYCELEDIL